MGDSGNLIKSTRDDYLQSPASAFSPVYFGNCVPTRDSRESGRERLYSGEEAPFGYSCFRARMMV